MCTIVKTIEQGQRIGKAIALAVAVSKAKTTHKRTCKVERYPQNQRYIRKTLVKSQQSVNRFILLFVYSVLDFGNLAVVLFDRSKQLSLNSLLSNYPNGQLTYIQNYQYRKNYCPCLAYSKSGDFKRAAHFTLPHTSPSRLVVVP